MTDPDDRADDAQLQSLRAVWLAMPDEEPPQRGLAELMAAARAKAEQMAKPSLWQRIVALLRRPPVLALASVMVILGGALFVGQRKDEMAVDSPAREVAQPPAQEQAFVGPGSANADEGVSPAPAITEAAPAAEVPTLIEEHEPAERPKAEPRPTTRVPPRRVAEDKTAPPAPDEATLVAPELAARGELRPAEEADVRPGATATPTAPSRTQQEVARAKSAASRGDCGAARVVMQRVAKDDAALYRKTIASDPAVKKCVAD